MMKKLVIGALIYIILYYLKVPVVVSFTQQVLATTIPMWNTLIDEWTHLSERHVLIYIGLVFYLVYLMMPTHPYRSLVIAMDD